MIIQKPFCSFINNPRKKNNATQMNYKYQRIQNDDFVKIEQYDQY
jgi:hypothetical protein